MMYMQKPVYYCKFRHIQTYSRPIKTFRDTVAYLEPCVTLASPEPCHIRIYNLIQIQNFVKAYSCIFKTLCKARILRPLSY